jgi:plastocyanin
MSKSTIGIISIVAILIIVGGIIYFTTNQNRPTSPGTTATPIASKSTFPTPVAQSSDQNQAATASPQSETTAFTVRYTDSGYTPDTIEIPVGSTVKFMNESSNLMWTASDPHPVHTNFSAFDARKGYRKGDTYSFTFDKAGTYKYHNHSVPSDGGTIVVK